MIYTDALLKKSCTCFGKNDHLFGRMERDMGHGARYMDGTRCIS
ncbi:15462_t:CDS:2 [Acaulospora morrowiae]|uniref:15462_t:CDS:1 n=1 Tax=Acaulospora morrowiae TaxID=94023 RepID=A0A9N8YSK8_9GLOM|nr:15462_t:CDS:2 [Acaulospora morrowiae]